MERHCAPLVADQAIELWSEQSSLAGEHREALRQHHLRRADLVLVLLSADLLADAERMALAQHALQQGKMVLPIYLRSCAWQSSALAGRAALPDDDTPVASAPNRDTAWLAVIKGIQQVLSGAPAPKAPPPRPSPPKSVTKAAEPAVLLCWLHLSDLHFGHPGQGWDQSLVLREVQRDFLAQRQRAVPPPHALLVTGDIAFRGAAEEYHAAAAFLRGFGVPDRQIFLVPGNHDVRRRDVRRSADRNTFRLLCDLRSGAMPLDEALDDKRDAKLLRARLAKYQAFTQAFGSEGAHVCGWTAPLSGSDGLRLRLIGLNTALLANDDQDQGKLRLGQKALDRAFAEAAHEERLLVLSHHPFRGGWLADQKDADGWVRSRAQLHLSGHVHEADSEHARTGDGRQILRISAGAAHGEAQSHGYNVAAILRSADGNLLLRLWPRRWADKKKTFVPDNDNLPEGQLHADHPLPD